MQMSICTRCAFGGRGAGAGGAVGWCVPFPLATLMGSITNLYDKPMKKDDNDADESYESGKSLK